VNNQQERLRLFVAYETTLLLLQAAGWQVGDTERTWKEAVDS
jgi:hypothetical protein